MSHTSLVFFSIIAVCGLSFANPVGATPNGEFPVQTVSLPDSLSNSEFYALIQEVSESDGGFHSENFTSNESSYLHPISILRKTKLRGEIYLGVGPEQNFTYIGEIKPRIAFILDIRRQNMLLHFLYKALFDLSTTRLDFLAKLLSKPTYTELPFYRRLFVTRPSWYSSETEPSILELLEYFDNVNPDKSRFDQNCQEIKKLVKAYGLTSEDDIQKIEYIYHTFFRRQLNIKYDISSHDKTSRFPYPSLRDLLVSTTIEDEMASFLSRDETYEYVKAMHRKNLIIPVVGDFSGDKAIRRVSDYVRSHGASISVFYTSNVEMYLSLNNYQQSDKFDQYLKNVSYLPIDDSSVFIRAYHNDHFTLMRYYPNVNLMSHPNRIEDHVFTTTVHSIKQFKEDPNWKSYRKLIRYYKIATTGVIE